MILVTANSIDDGSAQLQWICRSVLQANFHQFRDAEVRAKFYPYIGLTHTIRRKGTGWDVRISDHCRRAPRIVLEAVTTILACKVLRRRPPAEMIRIYDRFRQLPQIEEALNGRRFTRGRKQISQHEGRHHSLSRIYHALNERYFGGQIEVRKIGWGTRASRLRLGHYDSVHQTITISPALDSADVPGYVVSYIIYHEMLHTLFEGKQSTSRRRHHPPAFQKAERSYPDYQRAKAFLTRFCRRPSWKN